MLGVLLQGNKITKKSRFDVRYNIFTLFLRKLSNRWIITYTKIRLRADTIWFAIKWDTKDLMRESLSCTIGFRHVDLMYWNRIMAFGHICRLNPSEATFHYPLVEIILNAML